MVLATEDPDIIPINPEPITAAFAGPPTEPLSSANDNLIKKLPAPACSSRAPKSTYKNTKLHDTPSATPNTPSEVNHSCETIDAISCPL
ncbi:hypothetical protein ANAPC5_01479 [Anaplasma phagocytophilum]|nr:hypothetical protein ANAPC2_01329 [Anaplasma phagocytophilum]SBO33764.1 hypothetical protein ANAPC3_01345 [Anaplasma phagocytophilum]SBO33909.1 hypothetical protein ANAPC4_01356 [Anaplasma phagocytophilum]SCV66608.1 hypothetical protein ANAPC5_01479 [Anaplasma phagocytophilum]